jgi:hypothetical protein
MSQFNPVTLLKSALTDVGNPCRGNKLWAAAGTEIARSIKELDIHPQKRELLHLRALKTRNPALIPKRTGL